ncbi:MAG: 16S rRNA (cytidine(1402)-2'-O)-methyltransferase [Candidatus Neomarinimicrobiota bacterium]|jgi:16S rRNA (cytidine1402-2'-O)-methyltransferase|nr:16S rRNA (cytidine(1402)-2'-O)-methyltransferase [Candidatus Neomarinimicrobiota bacterium]|tara:strand:+ start:352 stop:1041 length:690 start_codon:yes stop_codon:yes gene_type:complete
MPYGILNVVSTPIGNLEDISRRAITTLTNSDIIVAEDTRHTKKLLNHYNISAFIISYFEHNKHQQIPKILNFLKEGKNISLVSDAGTPGISDPAYRLVRQAINENIKIQSVPGASSVLAALIPSGLPTDRFIFEGFLPPKKGRKRILDDLSKFDGTVIFFENPKRLHRTLNDILVSFGERPCVLARELTKIHEEFLRDNISNMISNIDNISLKGEMVVLIGKDDKNVYF